MKKRTLVCFLIFTLCVLHISIPDTVFGQEEGKALAQQVFDEHNQILRRANVKQFLPEIFEGLKGDLPLGLTIPGIIDLAIGSLETDPTGATLKATAAVAGLTLTDDHIALIADSDVQAMLEDDTTQSLLSLTGVELSAGLDELLRLINEAEVIEPTEPGPTEPTTPPTEPTTPPTEPTTPPTEPTTPPTEPTTPPTEPTTPPTEPTPPTTGELPEAELVASGLNPNGLLGEGKSRLGGLSLNQVHARAFIRSLIVNAGLDPKTADSYIEPAVDLVLAQIPAGFLPKKQIKQGLTSLRPFSIFQNEAAQLDFENFGNAISPSLIELLYDPDKGGDRVSKYLSSDNMNVYVRVPSTLEGGNVVFGINGYKAAEGKRITPEEFQADTVPYTFQLEESLAATNLPAWPGSNYQIFSEVVLRYSQEGLDGQYIALQMDAHPEDKGIVWKGDVGIIPGRNVFYYFEVTLTDPLKLEVVNPEALSAAILSTDGTHTLDATNSYRIENWIMPDPRNLQLNDRGIFEALFTADVKAKVVDILLPVLPALGSGDTNVNLSGKDLQALQNLLLRNVGNLFTKFENTFDPLLVSVFTVPEIDLTQESLWYANIGSLDDGAANFEARVVNADGALVDKIVVDFTVDDTAPETTLRIGEGNTDTAGYWNKDNIFVATNHTGAAASLLNIDSILNPGTGMLGRDHGWLIYQIIDLDSDGNAVGTWLPLTVENSMLASDIWDIVKEQLSGNTNLTSDPTVQLALTFDFDAVLGLITPGLLQTVGNPLLQSLNLPPLDDVKSQFLVDLIGAVAADLNSIPLTYDADRDMPMAFMKGDYGLRAMGIDNLLNVGSHIPPTHVRIVDPEHDRTSITLAALGDINKNGKDDDYENNVIYVNATDVTLTVTVNERTVHPGMIMVQYENADGDWTTIGDAIELVEATGAAGDIIEHAWSVSDFGDLVAAGDYVRVRTVTSNGLKLIDESEPHMIKLDADVHPVDPTVLVVDVDDASITMTNQDSGAPQGTIMLDGYTPRRTVPATSSIRVEAKRAGDEAWTMIGEVAVDDPAGKSGTDTAAIMFNGKTLADVYVDHMLHIQDSGSYLKWIVTVDTTALEDTITKDSPAARDATLDENQYMVRAYAVGEDGSDISPVTEGEMYTDMFSVDNDDDVEPLGPTNVVVSSDVDGMYTVFEDHGDGTYTVGGLVDKYDPDVKSPVITLMLTPEAARSTYAGVKLITDIHEDAIIGEVTETAEGSGEFTVTIDIGTLMDGDDTPYNDRYLQDPDDLIYNPTEDDVVTFMVHALAYDKAEPYDDVTAADETFLEYGNIQADDYEGDEITINVMNSYRPDPGVLGITVENSDGMVNPDSKAPKYELTFNAYTYGLTSPPTEAVRFEVKRPGDSTWERITGTIESEEVSDADLAGIITGLVQITGHGLATGGDSEFAIPNSFHKFSVTVDTRELALADRPDEPIKLGDTIKRGDDAERDFTLDDNQYQVRAISLTPKNPAQAEYPQRDGVDAHFSLDNDDDVPPFGPTNITDVADVAGSILANEDGSYTVNLIADDPALSTDVMFAIKPTAEPITYKGGSIRLVQTDADGNETETDGSLEDGYIKIDTEPLPNGTYMYHALTIDEHGNAQVQGEEDMPSPVITVHVNNFRRSDIMDLTVTSVDGSPVEGELPERIPLRQSIAVSFNVPNGTLMVEDLTGVTVNGYSATHTPNSDAENMFSLMADNLSEAADGWYTAQGVVTKRNGSVSFDLADINLDNTGPMITILTPGEGDSVRPLPTLQASYNDGDLGIGVSEGTAVVSLARLRPEEVVQDPVPIDVDQSMVEQDIDSVVYTRTDRLAGGAYQFTVQVTDSLGTVGEATVTFAVEGINPTVVITAPASGQQFDASPDSVTGFYAGGGEVNITKFADTGEDVSADVTVDGNNFTYVPAEGFSEGDHTISVEVTDGSGLTSQTSLTFTVEYPVPTATITTPAAGQVYSHGNPIITGTFSGADPVTGTLTLSDADGNVISEMEVSGNDFEYTPADALGHGSYTVSIMVTDVNGNTADASTDFSVDIAGPSVAIHAPAAGQMFDHGMPVITVESSGEAGPVSVSVMVNGEAASMNENGTYSPAAELGDGDHTVVATATDANGKTAEATVIFSVLIPGPSVAINGPAAGQMFDHGMPVITVESSGIAEPVSVSVMVNGEAASMNENGTYSPATELGDGDHTVVATATDDNGKTAEATVIFSVFHPEPTVSISSPDAGGTYDHTFNHISGEFTGVGEVTVSLMLDDEAVDVSTEANQFSAILADKLAEGKYMVTAMVTAGNGKTAQTSSTFSIVYPEPTVTLLSPQGGHTFNHGKPIISGEYTGVGEVEVVLTVDAQPVPTIKVGDNGFAALSPELGHGDHVILVTVTDENEKTAQTGATFTVDIPGPAVEINSPAAGQMLDHGMPVITVESSGVADPVSVSVMVNGEAATMNEDGTYSPAAELGDGDHTVEATATDANGKTADATVIFSVFHPEPTVSISSPDAGGTYDHSFNLISGEFAGVGEVSVSLMLDGEAVDVSSEGNQFSATLSDKLTEGEHMVTAMVTAGNGKTAQTSTTFSVVYPEASVSLSSPDAGDTYDHTFNHISGMFTGVGDVSVNLMLDGEAVEASIDGNNFTATLSDKLSEGEHTVSVMVTDVNDETAQTSATFSVVYPDPTVTLLSPQGGHIFNHGKPIISGEYTGVGEVQVALTVDGNEVPTAPVGANGFAAESPELGHGDHVILVTVTDANGKMAQTGATITVDIPGPAVAILSPAPGQTYEHGEPVIRAEFSGMTDVNVTTFTLNGEDVELGEDAVEDNMLTYVPAPALGDGEHTVVVEVTDANKKMARASVVFVVAIPKDVTPPVISEVSPSGVIRSNSLSVENLAEGDYGIIISAVVTDEQSSISGLTVYLDNQPGKSVPPQNADNNVLVEVSVNPGPHKVRLVAISEGGTREYTWWFTLEVDHQPPVISNITPAGTIHAGLPTISASATDEAGVTEITFAVMDSNGEEVKGKTSNDEEDRLNRSITRADFMPEEPLTEGYYSIEVRATDAFGNSSTSKGGFTIDFDTAAPIITSAAPQNGARLMYKYDETNPRPVISITFADAETGINPDSIRLVIESPKAGGGSQAQPINLSDDQMSATQVLYTPDAPAFPNGFAEPGVYTVTLEVSDNAHQQGNVSDESDGAREANMAVYQFTFTIEFGDVPIISVKPYNFPNPFSDTTRICFGLNQQSSVSIVIYDATLRPVRTLVDNQVLLAGNHTGENGIGWDGKTSAGEDLARGIYFCEITVTTNGVEPEYAILKLALTR